MSRLKALVTSAVAVLVTAAATLSLPVAPARATGCDGGVSVLVDFGALGGGSQTGCGQGATMASEAFTNAGFRLTQHPRQPGFVCTVQGKPSDGNCMGTSAYWAFFVDEGSGWAYASVGVYQQSVHAGDAVALVWQCSPSRRGPGQASSCASPTPKASASPTRQPRRAETHRPTPKPTASPTRPTTSAPPTASPTGSVTPATTATTSSTPPSATISAALPTTTSSSAIPSPMPSQSPTVDAATEPTATDDGGLPGWVPPLVVAVLVAAAGGVAWARRAR